MAACNCGKKLIRIEARSCYPSMGSAIACNDCQKAVIGNTIVYHCPTGYDGCEFDLCSNCALKREKVIDKFKDVQDIANTLCICGKSLYKTHAKDCYNSYKSTYVICNKCNSTKSGLGYVYHCKNGQMNCHQSGYDLCIKCGSLENIHIQLTKQQIESINILNDCYLTKDLIRDIKLFIIEYSGELVGIDLINNLEFNENVKQDLSHKNEWIKMKSKLANWGTLSTLDVNKWSIDHSGFKRKVDDNGFALGLKGLIKRNKSCGYSQDLLIHIKSNIQSTANELDKSQSVSDMYNSSRYPQYNWCIFIHQTHSYYDGSKDCWKSFWIESDKEWNKRFTILELQKQITLRHRVDKNKKFWFLKIAEYERKIRLGKDIYCIVEHCP